VKHNAVRHGVLSSSPVIPYFEREEDWRAHRDGITTSLAPEGPFEAALVERVALTLWRLRRVGIYEREEIALTLEGVEEEYFRSNQQPEVDPSSQEVVNIAPISLDDLRGLLNGARAFADLCGQLRKLADSEPLDAEDANELLTVALEIADVEPDGLSLADLPPAEEWETFDGWTAGLVRRVIDVIADDADPKADTVWLHDAITGRARSNLALEEIRLENAKKDIARAARRRFLPDSGTLQKIARYEAHLNRQMYQALHELDALRSRRQGDVGAVVQLGLDAPGKTNGFRADG
jgi:hypothetical protein